MFRTITSKTNYGNLDVLLPSWHCNVLQTSAHGQVMPPLHHEDLMATADDQMGQKSEPTRDPVNVAPLQPVKDVESERLKVILMVDNYTAKKSCNHRPLICFH